MMRPVSAARSGATTGVRSGSNPADVFVVRHGETAWSLTGQHTDRTDTPLTENGCRLAERLRPVPAKEVFALVLVSPMQRARQTCELAGLEAAAIIDPDLVDWNYSECDGLTPKQIDEKTPGWLIFRDGCPGGEAAAQVGARVDRLVSSSMIDRVVNRLGRRLTEVPVGFKWFVPGLFDGACCFGGEESAGASFLRRDGTVWTTDKDGPIMDLLAAEITARTGKDPSEHYDALTAEFGTAHYMRIDAPATKEEKAKLETLSPEAVDAPKLADEPILAKLTRAPGNGAPIGGLKVVTKSGWFAARPSGTEAVYKIYAESFKDEAHLAAIVDQAQEIVDKALVASDPRRSREPA
jgi:hypothetical protein